MDSLKGGEYGFLLLTSGLGDPERKPLTMAQLRELVKRSGQMKRRETSRDVDVYDFVSIGYSPKFAQRIVGLLHDEPLLYYYLSKARKAKCTPVTRATDNYPLILRKRLALDCPGCLWAKGDLSLLETPMISLVGSRDLHPENRVFAEEVGRQAAKQGYTLVSGNARGADKTAQQACLANGGSVICVVADSLNMHSCKERVLYLSEDGYDVAFSAQRALSRNRIIHALGAITLVAQATLHTGGSWNGTVRNLQGQWSKVFCFDDGSRAAYELQQLGALPVNLADLSDYAQLAEGTYSLFDEI